jgi:DNA repair photolyase
MQNLFENINSRGSSALAAQTIERPVHAVSLVAKKGSTFHDFPYTSPQRKCIHCWIINVTPPGPHQCMHHCLYCYARDAVYSNYSPDTLVYNNLPELVEKDLKKLTVCPPVSISNVSDPCQDIPELRAEMKRLVELLMRYGVSILITTKGDPSFLLDIPGFARYEPKVVAVTVEGPTEVLQLVSPHAPSFYARLVAIRRFSSLGVRTVIRFDPVFIHLYQALFGESWFGKVAELIDMFAAVGARHIISSTGRLSKNTGKGSSRSTWRSIYNVIQSYSPLSAWKFENEYEHEVSWSGRGYMLRKDLRIEFHARVKELVEKNGMTYATCQELSSHESDSRGIPNCEGLPLPFTRKGLGGTFYPIAHCTAACYPSCRNRSAPPCGRSDLVTFKPLTLRALR